MTKADTTEDTEDAHVTLTAATPVVQQQSSSVSDLVSNHRDSSYHYNNPSTVFPVTQSSLQTPVTTTTTTYPSTTSPLIPNFSSLFGFNQRVTALESDISKLKQSNPFAQAISSILGIVNEYLGSKMKEAIDVTIQLKSNKLREEAQSENQAFLNSLDSNMQKIIKDQFKTQTSKIKSKVEKYVTDTLGAEVLIRSTNQPQTSYGIASSLSELELKRILMDKMEENKSIDRSNVQKNLYSALVEAYNIDKDLLSSYGDAIIIPTTRDDKDKDEEPSAGSNRGTKRRRSGKEAESSKEPTRKESRTTSSSKGASRSQPTDLNETTHLEFITGDDDVNPAREITDLAQAAGTQSSFDEFMATPIDFSAFMINRLKIDHLTQELLTGPTYDLIKGGRSSRKYTTSITKTKAADYGQVKWIEDWIPRTTWSVDDVLYKFREGDFKRLRRQDIEDMVLLLVQGKLTNLSLDERYALNVALKMYTQRIVIQERVEDLQLAIESYKKKINLTRPDTTRPNLRKMTPYTGYPNVQGIIYQDELSRNRLMRTDELHKFSDATLNHVRTTLNDIATGIQIDYFPKRRWSPQDKRRARVMISAIDKKLRD
ncbi:hypothetical protein Tco_1146980 [Tanacetum coccineum]